MPSTSSEPDLSIFRCRKDGILRQRGLMLLDGEKVVARAYASGLEITQLLITERLAERYSNAIAMQPCTHIIRVSIETMESIIGHRIHQGMIAVAKRPNNLELTDLSGPLVVLDGILDPENVGTILRNSLAFGFRSILADRRGCSPFYRRSIRVSMGAAFRLAIRETDDLAGDLTRLKNRYNLSVITTSDRRSASPVEQVRFDQSAAVVLGNEDKGVSAEIDSCAELNVRIAIDPSVDSLSVSAASGVLLYEISKAWRTRQNLAPEITRRSFAEHSPCPPKPNPTHR